MYQGQELYEKLETIYDIMTRYAYDTEQYLLMLRKLREDRQYIETESSKGKMNLTIAVCIVMLAIFSILFALFTRDFSGIWLVIAGLAVYFVCKNTYPKIAKIAIAVMVVQFVFDIQYFIERAISGSWLAIILIAIVAAVAIVIVRKALEINRSQVDSYNQEVREYNAPYIQKYQRLYAECQELEEQLVLTTQGWYPPDYVYQNAVEFFIDAMKNGKADNMRELVRLYDEQLKHNEIVSNQQQQMAITKSGIDAVLNSQRNIRQELQFSNMLGLYRVFQLHDIQQSLR